MLQNPIRSRKNKVALSEDVNYSEQSIAKKSVKILSESYQLHLKQLNKPRRNHTEETPKLVPVIVVLESERYN